jgi:hypothetical protein
MAFRPLYRQPDLRDDERVKQAPRARSSGGTAQEVKLRWELRIRPRPRRLRAPASRRGEPALQRLSSSGRRRVCAGEARLAGVDPDEEDFDGLEELWAADVNAPLDDYLRRRALT